MLNFHTWHYNVLEVLITYFPPPLAQFLLAIIRVLALCENFQVPCLHTFLIKVITSSYECGCAAAIRTISIDCSHTIWGKFFQSVPAGSCITTFSQWSKICRNRRCGPLTIHKVSAAAALTHSKWAHTHFCSTQKCIHPQKEKSRCLTQP